MQKYANSVQDPLGNAIGIASVSVYTNAAHTILASLYLDNGITPVANPLTTNSLGEFSFYAADGRYYIVVSKTGITTQSLDDVLLFDSTASGSSANINFVQSGTAPTTRNLQDVSRAVVRSGDFASTTNYLARLEALTETFGVSKLNIKQQSGIRYQTSASPFTTHTGQSTFNGTIDNFLLLAAYNITEGTSSTKIDAAEPTLFLSMEANYNNGSAHLMEMNIDYNSADNLTYKRFFGFNVNRATHVGDWACSPNWRVDGGTLGSGTYILIDSTSGVNRIAQIRQAGGSGEYFQVGGNGVTGHDFAEFGWDVIGAGTSKITFASTGASILSPAALTVNTKKVPTVLGVSGAAVSCGADVTEDTLATITVPANSMGANGAVRIHTFWTVTSSGNNKTLKVRFGGASGTAYMANVVTAVATVATEIWITNRGATNSQVGNPNTGVNSAAVDSGVGGVAFTTSAVDTTSSTTIVITGQKASSGETLTLESYVVELIPG